MSQDGIDNREESRWKLASAAQLVKEFDTSYLLDKETHYLLRFGPFTVKKPKDEPQYLCDCPYPTTDICIHAIAAEEILSNLESGEVAAESHSRQKKKPFQIRTLIREIPEEDLRDITGEFARKNRAFAFMLKARFLEELCLNEDPDMYLQLYNELIHQRSAPSSPLSAQDMRIFKNITDTLLRKMREALLERDFRRAFYIIYAVLDRLSLVMYRTPKSEDKLLALWRDAHDIFSELIQMVEAQALLDQIEEALYLLAGKLYYKYRLFDTHAVHLILQLGGFRQDRILIESLEHRLPTEQDPEMKRNTLGAALLLGAQLPEEISYIPSLCHQHLETGMQYLQLAGNLVDSGHQTLGLEVLDTGRKAIGSLYYEQAFIRLLIQYKRPQEEIIQALITALKDYPTPKIFEHLHLPIRATEADKLIRFVRRLPYNDTLLCAAYLFAKDYPAAFQQIQKIALEEALPLDATLWKELPDEMMEYYLDHLEKYLKHHLGPKAKAHVRGILRHIQQHYPSHKLKKRIVKRGLNIQLDY